MIEPKTDTEKLIHMRNTAGLVGFLLDDPTPKNLQKAQKHLAEAIAKTTPGNQTDPVGMCLASMGILPKGDR